MIKEDIIGECVALAVEGSWVSKTIFRGKLRHGQIPSTKIAQEQCYTAWSYGSVSQVLGIFVFSVVPAIIFFLLAYTYYRQTTDPTHSASLNSKNSDVAYVHMEAYPNDNSPIFSGTQNPNGNGDGVDDAPLRARTSREQQKTNQNRAAVLLQQSVIMHSANDSPYGVSPGPPSYAPLRGTYGYGHVWFRGADGDVGGQR
ncbi:hypothetical protein C0989_010606 [Termitomyces sp. Mn162]|nr:hypothetical protein C0989_010606 [Termitomyces sp. Mn162]